MAPSSRKACGQDSAMTKEAGAQVNDADVSAAYSSLAKRAPATNLWAGSMTGPDRFIPFCQLVALTRCSAENRPEERGRNSSDVLRRVKTRSAKNAIPSLSEVGRQLLWQTRGQELSPRTLAWVSSRRVPKALSS